MKGLTRWDPFRVARWDPFKEIREMQYEMDRLFDRFGLGRDISVSEPATTAWIPAVESYMKGDHLVLKCELPGMEPKDVDVSVDEKTRQLAIRGERKTETETKDEEYIHRELTYGTFERRFTLPEGSETAQVKAKFSNGILEISVPAVAASKAKKIEIETPKVIEGEAEVKKKAA